MTMVLIGGAGNLIGSIIGTIALIILPELIGFIPAPPTVLGYIHQMIYGIALVLVMFIRPEGLLKEVQERQWTFNPNPKVDPIP